MIRHLADITTIPSGTVIGFVRVGTHIEHRVSSEYAAWGHTIMGDKGHFPIKLVHSNDSRNRGLARARLVAEIPGTVVSNDYQSRCGGVAYGSERINDMKGQRDSFVHSWTLGNLFCDDKADEMFYIEPEYVAKLVEEVQNYLYGVIHDYKDGMDQLISMLQTPCGLNGQIRDDKYNRYQTDQMRWQAESMAKNLRIMEEIQGAKRFRTEPLTVEEQIEGWNARFKSNLKTMDANDNFHGIDTKENIPFPLEEETCSK